MKNMWGNQFNEMDIRIPTEIIEEQINFLPKLTGDLVYAELIPLSSMDYAFSYNFNIRSKFLDSYNFRVFTIRHDLLIYPVSINVDPEICAEIGIHDGRIEIEDQSEFENMFEAILKTERIKMIIGVIMKMSKNMF